MKKKLYCLMAAASLCMVATAQTVTVEDVEVLSSGETVSFYVHYAGVEGMTSTHFEIGFPSWVTVDAVEGTNDWTGTTFSNEGGSVSGMCPSTKAFTGEGDIAKITITAAAKDAGTYPVTISNIRINGNILNITPTFNINVVDMHTVILDENSISMLEAAEGVSVIVKRTINANEWSTICLPFDMTEAQVKTAFGDEVLLKDFTGYDTVEDDEENIAGITVNFVDAVAIEANHPYLIKVSAPVSEFTVDGVDIDPEEEPTVSFGFTTGKGSKAVYHPIDFNGTYTANTLVPENDLFLSGNKFWYSTGATSMKAFRAYFEFDDVLTEVDEGDGARIFMSFGNEDGTTGVSDAMRLKNNEQINNNWYDLQGRRVQRSMFNVQRSMLKKGLYIVNNKKVVVK